MPSPPPATLRGPIPRLDTLHRIESILRRAAAAREPPLPLAEIKRRLPTKSIRHTTVRACVNELVRLGLAQETQGTGVAWAPDATRARVAPPAPTRPPPAPPERGPRAIRARLHKRYRLARDLRDVPAGRTVETGLELIELGHALQGARDDV